MIPKSSFVATSGLLVVACSPDLDHSALDVGPPSASFAHDLRTSEGGGGTTRLITPWPAGTISYAFLGQAPNLNIDRFLFEAEAGLREWERVTGGRVRFVESDPYDASILISFRPGDHGGDHSCDDQFTTPEETIAHVFTYDQNCLAGVIHLNQDLTWIMNGSDEKDTYDVRYVILHEVGHLLGLAHHPEPGHIMHPDYIGAVRHLTKEEGQDAIAALEEI